MTRVLGLLALCLFFAALGYAVEPPHAAAGAELSALRTENSRTYVTGDGRFATDIYAEPVHRLDERGGRQPPVVDSASNCYAFNYGTGYVSRQSSTYEKVEGTLWWRSSTAASQLRQHAWFKFDLSAVPPGATIVSCTLKFYCTQADNGVQGSLRSFDGNPTEMAAQALYTAIHNGIPFSENVSYSPWAWWRFRFIDDSPELAYVQQCHQSQRWVAFGFRSADGANDKIGSGYGYDHGLNGPHLAVVWSPPPFYDVGVENILSPSGRVLRNSVVAPIARFGNFGNQVLGFTAYCQLVDPLGAVFDFQTVGIPPLPAGHDTIHSFMPVNIGSATGIWKVRCSTYTEPDFNPANNVREELFEVVALNPDPDMEARDILKPAGMCEKNSTVTPAATWRNNSSLAANFKAFFSLSKPGGARVYHSEVQAAGLAGGSDTTLSFPNFIIDSTTGNWTSRCSTHVAGDVNPGNDVIEETFQVVDELIRPDIEAVAIIAPTGSVDTGATVTPRARWRNRNDQPMDFMAYFFLSDPAGGRVYGQAVPVAELAGRADTVIEFTGFAVGTVTGRWTARCSTFSAEDEDHDNDVRSADFHVITPAPPWEFGWKEMKPLPVTLNGKAVKQGGWLVCASPSGPVYAARGNKTGDFYRYHPTEDTWIPRAGIPDGFESKPPYKGCKAAYDFNRDEIYMTKGNNTLAFWRYSVSGDSWHQMPDVPLGPLKKKVKGGNDLEYVAEGGAPSVYLLKGYKNEFYRFNVAADTWEILAQAPPGPRGKWDLGSFLAYDGTYTLFGHMAKHHQLWKFDVRTDSWVVRDTLAGMPLAGLHSGKIKNKKAKDGSCGAWHDGFVYALKGGNTQQFFRYAVDRDTWQELDTMPTIGSTGRRKRVKTGADLTSMFNSAFFALKGNKTLEFWRYVQRPEPAALRPGAQSSATPRSDRAATLHVSPNPVASGFATVRLSLPEAGPVTVTLFDIAGRCVLARSFDTRHSSFALPLDIRRLSGGIYLVRLASPTHVAVGRLVVGR